MLKTKAYKFIIKVGKFQLPNDYSFNIAEEETWLWVDSAPLPGLNRVNIRKTTTTENSVNSPIRPAVLIRIISSFYKFLHFNFLISHPTLKA